MGICLTTTFLRYQKIQFWNKKILTTGSWTSPTWKGKTSEPKLHFGVPAVQFRECKALRPDITSVKLEFKWTLFFDGRVGHVSDGETTNPTIFRILRAPDPKSGSAITGRNDNPRNIRNLTSESKIDTLFIWVHIRRRRYLSADKNYLRGHQQLAVISQIHTGKETQIRDRIPWKVYLPSFTLNFKQI